MIKKVILATLSCFLLFSSVLSANTSNIPDKNNVTSYLSNDYKIEVLEDTELYQKIEITNVSTGEVEYLESFLLDGEYTYKSTNIDGIQTITSDENNVTINDNGKIQTLSRDEIVNDVVELTSLEFDEQKFKNNENDNIIQPLNLYKDVPKKTSWSTYSSYKSSREINVATASLLAGILASIAGGPISGVTVTVAGFLIGINAKKVYYKVTKQTRFNNGRQVRQITKYYRYHDYTGYINTVTTPPRNVCFACLP